MKKATYVVNVPYVFDPTHKGAPYSLNGGANWTNGGELKETLLKAALGYEARKDANTPYDMGSDIEELNASVKSNKATLVNKVLGTNYMEVKATYFATVHSTTWIWVSLVDEVLVAYYMNAEEFSEFMDNWASFDNSRKVIRFKAESMKMLQWLEARA